MQPLGLNIRFQDNLWGLYQLELVWGILYYSFNHGALRKNVTDDSGLWITCLRRCADEDPIDLECRNGLSGLSACNSNGAGAVRDASVPMVDC